MFASLMTHAYWLVVVLFGVAGILWFWHTKYRKDHIVSKLAISDIPQQGLELPPSPLLSMAASTKLTQGVLVAALERQCDEIFTALSLSGDGLNIVIEGMTSSLGNGDIVYKFSNHAMKLYRSGEAKILVHEATGKLLPVMQDSGGRFLEQAKGTISLAPHLAQVGSLAVSAAHLIAGYDLSRRVANLQKSVEFLIAAREIDQQAILGRSFVEARMQLAKPPSAFREAALEKIRYDLAQLRMAWRGEIVQSIAPTKNLKEARVWHLRTKARNKGFEKDVLKYASSIAEKLEATGAALMIDTMIAFSTGTLDDLRHNVLAREVSEWDVLDQMAREMVDAFHDKRKAASMRLAEGIAGYVRIVRQLRIDPLEASAGVEVRKGYEF